MTPDIPSPEERHEAALEDGSGVSAYVARLRAEVRIPSNDQKDEIVLTRKLSQPRHIRRKVASRTIEREVPSGQDVSRALAIAEAIESPDERTAEEIIEYYTRGAALARIGLSSPIDRIIGQYRTDMENVDPDYRDRDEKAAKRQLLARLKTYEDQQNGS